MTDPQTTASAAGGEWFREVLERRRGNRRQFPFGVRDPEASDDEQREDGDGT